MARSRLYSITSILPRNRSVMAWVHGSTRSGCQSLSRNRTIVMVHLLSRLVCFLEWSPSTDLNGPLPGTGRVRRHLRLKGRARRSPHQAIADLQTCDTRSAGAFFIRAPHSSLAYQEEREESREVAPRVAGVGIEPTWFQAYEAWQGPA